jgi:phosphomannomutase/phosphoglucomutase
MVDALPKTFSTPEIRVDCPEESKFKVVSELINVFKQKYQVVDTDGARIIFKEGWGLVRASNTQPILVTRYEASSPKALTAIRDEVQATLQKLLGS